MDLNKKLSISFVHVIKTTPMLGNKCMSTSQPTMERSIQSHTNPHHPMHGEQINKPMDDWIDMFNPTAHCINTEFFMTG